MTSQSIHWLTVADDRVQSLAQARECSTGRHRIVNQKAFDTPRADLQVATNARFTRLILSSPSMTASGERTVSMMASAYASARC